jgi:hypothetical protein
MADLLADVPSCLYAVDDPLSLADALLAQLQAAEVAKIGIEDWATMIDALEPELCKLIHRAPNSAAKGANAKPFR